MAGGLPDGHLLEFEDVTGHWVDVSADVAGGGGVDIVVGRQTDADDGQPSSITAALRNPGGRWTPDNSGSDLWPNVVEGKRLRYTITKGATVSKRGTWKIKNFALSVPSIPENSTVTITGLGRMADLARQALQTDLAEMLLYTARSVPTWVDIYPLQEPKKGSPNSIKNVGNSGDLTIDPGDDPAVNDGRIVKARGGKGQVTYTSAEGMMVEGALSFAPNDNVGPVALLPHQPEPQVLGFFFRTTATPSAGSFLVIACGRERRSTLGNNVAYENWALRMYESAGTYPLQLWVDGLFTATLDLDANDGAWHSFIMLQLAPYDGNTAVYYDSYFDSQVAFAMTYDIADQQFMVLGGRMDPYNPGKQSRCMAVDIAHPFVMGWFSVGGYEVYAMDNVQPTDVTSRFVDFRHWSSNETSMTLTSSSSQPVAWKASAGRSVLEVLQELARTVGGTVWERPSDNFINVMLGDALRPTTAAFTITLGSDDDGSAGQLWARGAAENPTRQTVNSPAGEVTYIDKDAELTDRRDGSTIETIAATTTDARSIAAWYVRHRKSIRIKGIGVDAVTTGTDLWASLLAMKPGTRVTVAGLSATVMGRTTMDVHVLGWTESHRLGSSRWTLQTEAADSPAELVLDDDLYDRLDFTIDDGTVATTAMTSASGSFTLATSSLPLTVDPADYPLYLTIGTEDMLVSSPPASATSPQTVTVTRAQRGTVAAAHAIGSLVHLTPSAGFAP